MNSYRTNINNADKIIFNETNSFLGFSFYQDFFGKELLENTTLTKYLKINPYLLNIITTGYNYSNLSFK